MPVSIYKTVIFFTLVSLIKTLNLTTSTISLDLSLALSLELSLDKSLAKGPRNLRCCHLDGLNLTDQCKVVAYLIYNGQCLSMPVNASSCRSLPVDAGRCWSMLVDAGRCRSMPGDAGRCRAMPGNASRCRAMPVNAGQCRSMPVSIYKTGIYLMLVSWIQTIKVTTSQHPWDLGQGVVQGRFQGICSCYFLGTFLGQFLGQGPKNP